MIAKYITYDSQTYHLFSSNSKRAAIEKIKDETRCKGEIVSTISVFKIGGTSQFYVPYQRK